MNRREAIKRTAAMLGAAMSSSMLAGCLGEDRSNLAKGLNWKPQFVTNTHARLLNATSELLLPRSYTPSAADVGVPAWIDVFYGKYMSPEEKTTFDRGMTKLNSSGFQDKSADAQATIMAGLGSTDEEFAKLLRGAILTGYFTSEEICTKVTTYDPVPGAYVGCVPISETGNKVMSEPR
ncbi:MAG: gluconate 2-dehydrogenase subunit 3 family protein [Verrucomicrobiae bacterium]|nr:gluconate 2-dehydrogenase subunit 3 family protein [Verrucomicrobiae bacterium]